jgi:hypothetical protein
VHLKVIRLFVESVLRYGLPANYVGLIIKVRLLTAQSLWCLTAKCSAGVEIDQEDTISSHRLLCIPRPKVERSQSTNSKRQWWRGIHRRIPNADGPRVLRFCDVRNSLDRQLNAEQMYKVANIVVIILVSEDSVCGRERYNVRSLLLNDNDNNQPTIRGRLVFDIHVNARSGAVKQRNGMAQ